VRANEQGRSDLPLEIRAESHPSGVVVVRLQGAIDAAASDLLDKYLHVQDSTYVVDLSEVTLLSAAAIRVLAGHKLRVVASTPHIQRVLQLTEVMASYNSVPAAIAAQEDAGLRQQVFDLRAALRTRPHIARALGMLQGRYALTDADTAFELLRDSAQRYNLRLYTLASALLSAPPPRHPTDRWFPGRVPRPAPELTFRSHPADRRQNRTAVLSSLLDAVLGYMATTTGDVQVADENGLRLEQHRGLPPDFLDFFATVDDATTSCAVAQRRKERVVVTDVATDPIFAGTTSGQMLVQAGIQAVQSTPLIAPSGRCVGVVSTHHTQRGHTPTEQQCDDIDRAVKETAAWLEWHQRTVVLDALEHLHQQAARQS
jgi:anti-anti-sigma regulatory factor